MVLFGLSQKQAERTNAIMTKRLSAKRGKAYMICFAFIWGGVMLSEFVRRVF